MTAQPRPATLQKRATARRRADRALVLAKARELLWAVRKGRKTASRRGLGL